VLQGGGEGRIINSMVPWGGNSREGGGRGRGWIKGGGGSCLCSPPKKVLDDTWASGLVMGFAVGPVGVWWADRWAKTGRLG
jgi:hypothetical protein